MAEETTTTNNTSTNGDTTNATRELLSRIDALNTQVSKLQGEAGGYKSAAQKAQEGLSSLKSQYEERNTELATVRTEFETTQTKLNETLGLMAETVTAKSELSSKLSIYQEIAATPEYHPLLDMVDMLNLPEDAEARKGMLDKLALKFTTTAKDGANRAIADFTAGGTLAGSTSPGSTPGGESTPSTFEEAIASAYKMLQDPKYDPQQFETALINAQKLKQ